MTNRCYSCTTLEAFTFGVTESSDLVLRVPQKVDNDNMLFKTRVPIMVHIRKNEVKIDKQFVPSREYICLKCYSPDQTNTCMSSARVLQDLQVDAALLCKTMFKIRSFRHVHGMDFYVRKHGCQCAIKRSGV